jgi:hypothetical protein
MTPEILVLMQLDANVKRLVTKSESREIGIATGQGIADCRFPIADCLGKSEIRISKSEIEWAGRYPDFSGF